MVPTPQLVYSVEVRNDTRTPLKFKVTYDNSKDKTEMTEEHVVQPTKSYLFKEKLLDMGGWQQPVSLLPLLSLPMNKYVYGRRLRWRLQAVAPVVQVAVEWPSGSLQQQVLKPKVDRVVKVLKVVATENKNSSGGVTLRQQKD
ncbi:hypothetical protein VOLCADRAFT_89244 [Volvox carteri f. nagariensis]|uniref:Uncharacterized protein n=1 Tax=Volvox carteri f. nagariensis TaxID=3068 RepID=D8TR70_VOLCA|nr:uncharacterized protein VOLCADRAFT_89244 [Volvox carteri f. nagariensis]EFJ49840.1 hypothetical protein VOLCADRAFT_89244 [Volvox carteri f. nagariensis]|eukprot:XP_002948905.1 hypothetical protein VOLCADRAFT_89244 [Volvox carteri f. nagariensis]